MPPQLNAREDGTERRFLIAGGKTKIPTKSPTDVNIPAETKSFTGERDEPSNVTRAPLPERCDALARGPSPSVTPDIVAWSDGLKKMMQQQQKKLQESQPPEESHNSNAVPESGEDEAERLLRRSRNMGLYVRMSDLTHANFTSKDRTSTYRRSRQSSLGGLSGVSSPGRRSSMTRPPDRSRASHELGYRHNRMASIDKRRSGMSGRGSPNSLTPSSGSIPVVYWTTPSEAGDLNLSRRGSSRQTSVDHGRSFGPNPAPKGLPASTFYEQRSADQATFVPAEYVDNREVSPSVYSVDSAQAIQPLNTKNVNKIPFQAGLKNSCISCSEDLNASDKRDAAGMCARCRAEFQPGFDSRPLTELYGSLGVTLMRMGANMSPDRSVIDLARLARQSAFSQSTGSQSPTPDTPRFAWHNAPGRTQNREAMRGANVVARRIPSSKLSPPIESRYSTWDSQTVVELEKEPPSIPRSIDKPSDLPFRMQDYGRTRGDPTKGMTSARQRVGSKDRAKMVPRLEPVRTMTRVPTEHIINQLSPNWDRYVKSREDRFSAQTTEIGSPTSDLGDVNDPDKPPELRGRSLDSVPDEYHNGWDRRAKTSPGATKDSPQKAKPPTSVTPPLIHDTMNDIMEIIDLYVPEDALGLGSDLWRAKIKPIKEEDEPGRGAFNQHERPMKNLFTPSPLKLDRPAKVLVKPPVKSPTRVLVKAPPRPAKYTIMPPVRKLQAPAPFPSQLSMQATREMGKAKPQAPIAGPLSPRLPLPRPSGAGIRPRTPPAETKSILPMNRLRGFRRSASKRNDDTPRRLSKDDEPRLARKKSATDLRSGSEGAPSRPPSAGAKRPASSGSKMPTPGSATRSSFEMFRRSLSNAGDRRPRTAPEKPADGLSRSSGSRKLQKKRPPEKVAKGLQTPTASYVKDNHTDLTVEKTAESWALEPNGMASERLFDLPRTIKPDATRLPTRLPESTRLPTRPSEPPREPEPVKAPHHSRLPHFPRMLGSVRRSREKEGAPETQFVTPQSRRVPMALKTVRCDNADPGNHWKREKAKNAVQTAPGRLGFDWL